MNLQGKESHSRKGDKEMEERRAYFAEMFNKTNKQIYRKMAESETDMISEVRNAICEAIVGRA